MKSRPDLHHVLASVAAPDAPESLLVATVLRAEGSTPVDAGAKAVIGARGLVAGTIGGGAVEAEALRRAEVMLHSGTSAVFDFALQGPGGTDPNPICGGLMRVLLQPLTAEDRCAYVAADHALTHRRRGVLETCISRNGSSIAQSCWVEDIHEPPWREAVVSPRVTHIPHSEETGERLLEPVLPRPVLLIVGAGHVGQALAAQAVLAGFDLAVIDDRADLMEPEGFPAGTRLLTGEIPGTVRDFPLDADTYVVLATRGHLADGQALTQCLRRPAAYLGMIGSRRKIVLMRQHFLTNGLATAEEFDRVHAPIGLDIGAETAPEIATSILAQMIAVRRGAGKAGQTRTWAHLK
ncbi:MAG TPA: XdhC family protein [Verrucomicrobiales bacterium]|jgi:xanthine dehydrogenase accessory factor|nr:XdhC family protein [Verrucomicrobiales bacterium]